MSDIFGDDDGQGSKKDDFGKMLEASLGSLNVRFEKGDKVEAEVMTVGKDDVFVTVNSVEGIVPKVELKQADGQVVVKVGDTLTLYYVKSRENLAYFTTKPSSKALSESLEDAFDLETPVEGKVIEAVNGGYRVEVMHKLAFCPISQIDIKASADPAAYIGKKFDFMITKFEQGGRNIVVSRRKVLDLERSEKEGDFLQQTQPGDMVDGKVSRLEAFGAFVDLGSGIEGLIHISEIGWSRLQHPSEALQVGDLVSAKVLKVEEDDRGRLRISLSRKQATDDPWIDAANKLSVGQIVDGKIREKAHFGWLVEIQPGVVGLLPKSAMKESLDERTLEQKKVGESLKLSISNINSADKRISLSLPRDQDDLSWQGFMAPTSGKSMGTLGDQFSKLFPNKK